MTQETSKLPPRAFGSILNMLEALRGKTGTAQRDLLSASAMLQGVDPVLSEAVRRISVDQQLALAKAEGRR